MLVNSVNLTDRSFEANTYCRKKTPNPTVKTFPVDTISFAFSCYELLLFV